MANYEDLIITEDDKKVATILLNVWQFAPNLRREIKASKDIKHKKDWLKFLDNTLSEISNVYDFLSVMRNSGKKKKISSPYRPTIFGPPDRYIPEIPPSEYRVTSDGLHERVPEDECVEETPDLHYADACPCNTCREIRNDNVLGEAYREHVDGCSTRRRLALTWQSWIVEHLEEIYPSTIPEHPPVEEGQAVEPPWGEYSNFRGSSGEPNA